TLPVNALLEAEADELLLVDLAAQEAAGLGVGVVELPLDDRDHVPGDVLVDLRVLQAPDRALAPLDLVVFLLELVRGGLGLRPHGDATGLHGSLLLARIRGCSTRV